MRRPGARAAILGIQRGCSLSLTKRFSPVLQWADGRCARTTLLRRAHDALDDALTAGTDQRTIAAELFSMMEGRALLAHPQPKPSFAGATDLAARFLVDAFQSVLTWWFERRPDLAAHEVDRLFRQLVHGSRLSGSLTPQIEGPSSCSCVLGLATPMTNACGAEAGQGRA